MKKLLEIKNISTDEYYNVKCNKYSIDYEKQWGNQQRNLVGSIRGTLIGISANINATTEYLLQDKMMEVVELLNQPYFPVRYFDTISNQTVEADYTSSDITTELIRINNKEYNAISFTLNAVDTRA